MADIWEEVAGRLAESGLPGGDPLGSAEITAVQDLLEGALAGPDRSELGRATRALEGAFRTVLAAAPPETVEAIRTGEGAPSLRVAYLLGQIAMAQGLVGRAYAVRTDADFAGRLSVEPWGPIVGLLADGDKDIEALALALGQTQAQAVPPLKAMITVGAVDFRVVGGRTLYGLTPSARAVVAARPTGKAA